MAFIKFTKVNLKKRVVAVVTFSSEAFLKKKALAGKAVLNGCSLITH